MADSQDSTDQSKRYQYVANQLAEAIRKGTYLPGQKLPSERDLAERFHVSRPTVREAMIVLDMQGMIEARHGSGVYVTSSAPSMKFRVELDIGEFELTEARRLFEGEAAALAATTISDEQLQRLQELLAEMKTEYKRDPSGESAERADRAFHVEIAKATRNSAIAGVIEELWDSRYKSPLCLHMLARARDLGIKPRIAEHQRILNALRARDPKAARKAMRDHLGRVIDALLKATELEAIERTRSELKARRNSVSRRISV